MSSSDLNAKLLAKLRQKLAAITPDQMGMPPGGDPAAMGMPPGMPPGIPPGTPPGGPNMTELPTEDIPSIEELADMGDPMAKAIVDIKEGMLRIETILAVIADAAGINVPLSKAIAITKNKPLKTASAQGYDEEVLDIYDDSFEDEKEAPEPPQPTAPPPPIQHTVQQQWRPIDPVVSDVPTKMATSNFKEREDIEMTPDGPKTDQGRTPPATWLSGRPGVPGTGGGERIAASLSPKPVKSPKTAAEILRKRFRKG